MSQTMLALKLLTTLSGLIVPLPDAEPGIIGEIVDQFWPDVALIVSGGSFTTGDNRVPGDLKVSWKWYSSKRFSHKILQTGEQELALVISYCNQHHARYGFVLTNSELERLKRLDENGRVAVATPIP
jgi:hypothetical protein